MQKIIKRSMEDNLSSNFQVRNNFIFSTVFEYQNIAEENIEELSNKRLDQLQGYFPNDDLTQEEITDIKEYRSRIGITKRFKNVKEFLKDLNE